MNEEEQKEQIIKHNKLFRKNHPEHIKNVSIYNHQYHNNLKAGTLKPRIYKYPCQCGGGIST
jgi:hypothetical protein